MRDVDDRHPFGFEPLEEGEETVDLRARERRRRLVEDQHARLLRGRLDDLGELLLPGAEFGDLRARVDVHAELCEEPACLLLRRAIVDEAETVASLTRQEDVLSHREGGDQAHLLEDHRDARAPRRIGRVLGERAAIDLDGACIGRVNSVEHLQDRALASTVLTEERVDLTLLHREAYIVERPHAPERLRHARHVDDAGHRTLPLARGTGRRARPRRASFSRGSARRCPALLGCRPSAKRPRGCRG